MSVVAEFANTQLVDVQPGQVGAHAAPTMITPLATIATPEAVPIGVAVTSATAIAVNAVTQKVAG
ncbi:linaridin family RiPP [Streptomyces inhibens]|uniref:Linaridin family RiPP n=1 Tax=Streptomyces inhibens TaxID=2293571 RepID=A0A371Q588_STRIH|nr:linaridin family RiPP [Streptomyces inhibens]REK89868.1 linaridin family RiPP [Streptomyces inhibens]